jgi:hypothetical protein
VFESGVVFLNIGSPFIRFFLKIVSILKLSKIDSFSTFFGYIASIISKEKLHDMSVL